jgi:hypothetical protein
MWDSKEREGTVTSGEFRPVVCPSCGEPTGWLVTPCPACGFRPFITDFEKAMAAVESGLLDDLPIEEDTGTLE